MSSNRTLRSGWLGTRHQTRRPMQAAAALAAAALLAIYSCPGSRELAASEPGGIRMAVDLQFEDGSPCTSVRASVRRAGGPSFRWQGPADKVGSVSSFVVPPSTTYEISVRADVTSRTYIWYRTVGTDDVLFRLRLRRSDLMRLESLPPPPDRTNCILYLVDGARVLELHKLPATSDHVLFLGADPGVTYDLIVRDPLSGRCTVSSAQGGGRFTGWPLAPGASLKVTVKGHRGAASVRVVWKGTTLATERDAEGSYVVRGLPLGSKVELDVAELGPASTPLRSVSKSGVVLEELEQRVSIDFEALPSPPR